MQIPRKHTDSRGAAQGQPPPPVLPSSEQPQPSPAIASNTRMTSSVYKATYSQIEVYENTVNSLPLMRRCDDNWVNATQIMKIAGYAKAQRTRILEKEVHSKVHRKIQGGHGKFQGTWVPLEFAKELAVRHNINPDDTPVLYFDPLLNPNIPNKSKPARATKASNNQSASAPVPLPLPLPLPLSMQLHTSENQPNQPQMHLRTSSSIDQSQQQHLMKRPSNADYSVQKKLSSPEKLKRDDPTLAHSQSFNLQTKTLPPTFGMYSNPDSVERQSKQHLKSKSFSNLPTQHQMISPTGTFHSNSQPMLESTRYRNYKNSQYKTQQPMPNAPYQQQQQQQQRQRQQQQQQQQQPISQQQIHHQRYVQQQYSQQRQHQQLQHQRKGSTISEYFEPDSNSVPDHVHPSIQSSETNDHLPTAYAKEIHTQPPYNNQPIQQFPDHDTQNHLSGMHNSPHIQNIYQTPVYAKHQRHHSSPHLPRSAPNMAITNTNTMTTNPNTNASTSTSATTTATSATASNSFQDNQEYYTSELLNFIVNGTQIPNFLIHKPIDFDINKPLDDEGHTPLHWAAALGSAEIIKLLIDNNANILLTNNQGMNPLSKLVKYMNSYDLQNFPVILALLKDCLVVPDLNKRTPLHYLMEIYFEENKSESSRYYFYEIIQFVNIQQQNAEHFNNTNSKEIKSRRILQLLLNHRDINGETALHIAMRLGNREFIVQLLKFGADKDLIEMPIPIELLKEAQPDESFANTMNLSMDINMSMMSNHPLIMSDDVYQSSFIQPVENVNRNNNHRPSTGSQKINVIDEQQNPFLVDDFHSDSAGFKDSPQTIITQRTPNVHFDDTSRISDNKENIPFLTEKNLTLGKLDSQLDIDMDMDMGMDMDLDIDEHTFVDKSMIDDNDNKKSENKDLVDAELLVVKPSKINNVEVDEFIKNLPLKITQLKNKLENKTDNLNHNVETINKLNTEISLMSNKNLKLIKKIYKAANPDSPKVNLTKITNSSTESLNNFISLNVSKFEDSLNEKRCKLLNIYERSQALEVAKRVNAEEEKITSNSIITKDLDVKLKLVIQLTLKQIQRRKIMEKTLQIYLNQGAGDIYNDDFVFDENVINSTNLVNSNIDNYRKMKSKIEVYKKLISKICDLQVDEINLDLLKEIEKTLS